jgi:hypothetical protein
MGCSASSTAAPYVVEQEQPEIRRMPPEVVAHGRRLSMHSQRSLGSIPRPMSDVVAKPSPPSSLSSPSPLGEHLTRRPRSGSYGRAASLFNRSPERKDSQASQDSAGSLSAVPSMKVVVVPVPTSGPSSPPSAPVTPMSPLLALPPVRSSRSVSNPALAGRPVLSSSLRSDSLAVPGASPRLSNATAVASQAHVSRSRSMSAIGTRVSPERMLAARNAALATLDVAHAAAAAAAAAVAVTAQRASPGLLVTGTDGQPARRTRARAQSFIVASA